MATISPSSSSTTWAIANRSAASALARSAARYRRPTWKPLVFSLKQGQIGDGSNLKAPATISFGSRNGRVAGKRQLDEQLQGEIRKKLEATVSEQEYQENHRHAMAALATADRCGIDISSSCPLSVIDN